MKRTVWWKIAPRKWFEHDIFSVSMSTKLVLLTDRLF